MKSLDAFAECEQILVVAAHADDLETMCGGTLIQLLAQGKSVELLIATDGDLGSADPAMTRRRLAALRREEAIEAGRLLGLRAVHFLGYPDGELQPTLALRRQVALAYRQLQPDTVFTFDPLNAFYGNIHPDHSAIAQSAIEAFMPAKMGLYHPEQLRDGTQPSRVRFLFCFSTRAPDILVPVDAVYPAKIAATLAHRSQFPNGEKDLDWMKARDRALPEAYPTPRVTFAEGFRAIATY